MSLRGDDRPTYVPMDPVKVSVTPSDPARSYWDSRARFYEERTAVAQQYDDMVVNFREKIDSDLEGYSIRRVVTGDDLAVRLKMAGHLIQKLAARIDELEENQYDPYDR
jgi:hypothetical protein